MRLSVLVVAMLLSLPAFAQSPDPDFMQKAIQALQDQRNRALDEAASAEANLKKDEAKISDLTKQLEEKKKDEAKKPDPAKVQE